MTSGDNKIKEIPTSRSINTDEPSIKETQRPLLARITRAALPVIMTLALAAAAIALGSVGGMHSLAPALILGFLAVLLAVRSIGLDAWKKAVREAIEKIGGLLNLYERRDLSRKALKNDSTPEVEGESGTELPNLVAGALKAVIDSK
jgi:hypothetical protein